MLLFDNVRHHRHKPLTRSIVRRLMTEVHIVKLSIVTPLSHQHIMATLLNNTTMVQYNNAVGITDS